MNATKTTLAIIGLIAGFGLASTAQAQNAAKESIFALDGSFKDASGTVVNDSIIGDQVFTIDQSVTLGGDNWYNLASRVIVLPGATLTIEPGTVFGSSNSGGQGGALIIAKGADIDAEGTSDNPIIFTSRTDLANWANDASHPTGKDMDDRGTYRDGFAEWGSVAILGDARISDNRQDPSNGVAFDVAKDSPIEGLPDTFTNDLNLYGGTNDDDDSGTFKYVSLSYGGDDFDPNDNSELNGMSIGGVGRGTDFGYVEILNNIDDGLEIFGGTVNISNLFIWNIGDDSLDGDQGYRGKIQYALIVQGFAGANGTDGAATVDQGSGFGDNGIEFDGADGDTSAQPVTATALWNATVIGAPSVVGASSGTDDLWALRDNLNMQIFNSLFITPGAVAVDNDGDDGDGSTGFGSQGFDISGDGDIEVAELGPFNETVVGFDLNNDGDKNDAAVALADLIEPDIFDLDQDGTKGEKIAADVNVGGGVNETALTSATTLDFQTRWATNADYFQDPVGNGIPNAGADPANNGFADAFTAQDTRFNLLDMAGIVFAQVDDFGDGDDASTGDIVNDATRDHIITDGMPIKLLERNGRNLSARPWTGTAEDGEVIDNVTRLDPRAAGAALVVPKYQPQCDFLQGTSFRGAVGPGLSWVSGWTAMSAIQNDQGDFILVDPGNPASPGASNVAAKLSASVTFDSVDGVAYELVAIDGSNAEEIVDTVIGDGDTITMTDKVNVPVDASLKYEVRVVGGLD